MNDKFSKWFDEYGRKWLTSSMNLSEIARGLAHAAYTKGLQEGMNRRPSDVKARRDAVRPTMSREGALGALRGFFCYEPQAYRNAIVSDMAADAKMLARALQVLAEEDQMLKAPPHVGVRKDVGGRIAEDGTPLDLNSLPDYETWFEKHGWETVNRDTRMAVIDSDVPATVHELYTHFRARLLDELRQAGVIGEDHE